MMKFISFAQRHWLKKTYLSQLLYPLSLLYQTIAHHRRKHTQVISLNCPVIVVGNIFVGGTGKTPVTIALIQYAQSLGYHVGVISRGYGAKIGEQPHISGIHPLMPQSFGDEPCLIGQHAPIAVHPDRIKAAQALLETHPEIDLIIADDGLQHYRLGRTLEIAVQDERGIGNGFTLPAGPLREPPERLNEVDIILNNQTACLNEETQSGLGFRIIPLHIKQLSTGKTISLEQAPFVLGKSLCALAGIGNPSRFFQTLSASGIQAQRYLCFKDHHNFSKQEIEKIPESCIIMTAKDAIKCPADDRIWILEIGVQWLPHNVPEQIFRKLKEKQHELL